MSKSRGNVVVLQEYIEKYGADTLRMYLLFLGPYDATLAWNERALLGVKRFLDRLGRFTEEHSGKEKESGPGIRAAINRLGKEVADDTAAFKYNTAIAHMMETLNTIQDLVRYGGSQNEKMGERELCLFSQILAPYAPFTAERLWQLTNGQGSVHTTAWPAYDPNLEQEERVTIAIQVNGKLRDTIEVQHQATEVEIRRLAESQPEIAKFLSTGTVIKVIYVPRRTMNFAMK
jgi:leucyl-tRNA synthetase